MTLESGHRESAAQVSAITPKTSFYREISLSPSADDPRRLIFIAVSGTPRPPDELTLLRQEFERTARVVSALFEDEVQTRKDMFLLMHQAADRGLRGPDFNIEDGRANLANVREEIVGSAYKIRDRRLKEYTKLLVIYGAVPLILGAIILLTNGFGWLKPPISGQPYDPLFAWVIAAFWIPAGAAFCVWAEFAMRMQGGLTYEQLLNMDPSRWRPAQRLLVTVGISFVFAFLLAFQAIQIGVGSLLLNDFATKTPALALAVGGITGLAFAAVQDIIFRLRPTEK